MSQLPKKYGHIEPDLVIHKFIVHSAAYRPLSCGFKHNVIYEMFHFVTQAKLTNHSSIHLLLLHAIQNICKAIIVKNQ